MEVIQSLKMENAPRQGSVRSGKGQFRGGLSTILPLPLPLSDASPSRLGPPTGVDRRGVLVEPSQEVLVDSAVVLLVICPMARHMTSPPFVSEQCNYTIFCDNM